MRYFLRPSGRRKRCRCERIQLAGSRVGDKLHVSRILVASTESPCPGRTVGIEAVRPSSRREVLMEPDAVPDADSQVLEWPESADGVDHDSARVGSKTVPVSRALKLL